MGKDEIYSSNIFFFISKSLNFGILVMLEALMLLLTNRFHFFYLFSHPQHYLTLFFQTSSKKSRSEIDLSRLEDSLKALVQVTKGMTNIYVTAVIWKLGRFFTDSLHLQTH